MKKLTIRRKMLLAFGFALVIIMLCMVVAFSMMLSANIKKSIKSQISQIRTLVLETEKEYSASDARYGDFLVEGIQRRVFASSGLEAMLVKGSKGTVLQNINYDYTDEKQVDLLAKVALDGSFEDGQVKYYSDNYGKYIVMRVNLGNSEKYKDCFAIVFSNLSQYESTVSSSEKILRLSVLIASVVIFAVVFLISENITRSIRKLCRFADELGSGNFETVDYDFSIKEFDELASDMNATALKLDKYDKNQKQFFQNVSHELRTPLMSIQGYAEGIQYGVFQNEKEAAGIIVDESKRLTEMLEQLIYISKVDTTALKLSPCDLCDILRLAKEKLDGLTVNSEKTIKLILPDEAVFANVDSEAILRAFINVISNGLRYAKSTVEVKLVFGASTVVTVCDDGEGIDKEDMPHIFDRFYKGKKGKHGIGLSIAETIMKAHGGSLSAENTEQGAKFTFTFMK